MAFLCLFLGLLLVVPVQGSTLTSMPPDTGVLASIPLTSTDFSTKFILLKANSPAPAAESTFFYIHAFVQGQKSDVSGGSEGPKNLTIEVSPVFPEKVKQIVSDAYGPIELRPANFEYLRIVLPDLKFYRTFRTGRIPDFSSGLPFRFVVPIPEVTTFEALDKLLGSRKLGLSLRFAWGPVVRKTSSATATAYDFYAATQPRIVLRNGLRVFDRKRFELAAVDLVKSKLAAFRELDVLGITLNEQWQDVISHAFATVTVEELVQNFQASPDEISEMGSTDELFVVKLAMPVEKKPQEQPEDKFVWPLFRGLRDVYIRLGLLLDKTTFPLGSMTYLDTVYGVDQELQLGWDPADSNRSLNQWSLKRQEQRTVTLKAPENCPLRIPVLLNLEMQPGQKVSAIIDQLNITGFGNAFNVTALSVEDEIPLVLKLGDKTKIFSSRQASLTATVSGGLEMFLDPAKCEEASGLSVEIRLKLEVLQ